MIVESLLELHVALERNPPASAHSLTATSGVENCIPRAKSVSALDPPVLEFAMGTTYRRKALGNRVDRSICHVRLKRVNVATTQAQPVFHEKL
jgi:hypothetical protein